MQCKSDNMAPKFGLFSPRIKCPKMQFRIELGPSQLVSKDLHLSSISYINCVKEYPVVLRHEATENLK